MMGDGSDKSDQIRPLAERRSYIGGRSESARDAAGMDRRTRVCMWVILLGLVNFLSYVILYWFFWGEAVNGHVEKIAGARRYFLQSGQEVSRAVFLYSGIHSISIAPTVGAIMLAMLTLAKERVISSMRRTIIRGRTMITVLATVIGLIVAVWTVWFILQFADRLRHPWPPTQAPHPPASKAARRQPGRLPRHPGG